jgi:hypothetical protein
MAVARDDGKWNDNWRTLLVVLNDSTIQILKGNEI